MRISDWSSDVCSSDLGRAGRDLVARILGVAGEHAGRLAGAADALDAFYRLGFGLGVRRLAQIAHRRRQVGRTDEQGIDAVDRGDRSEEHTSELQSLMRNSYAVFCMKKKQTKAIYYN